jgi:hypothetical protein
MSGVLRYLISHHGTGAIESLFGGEIAEADTSSTRHGSSRWRAEQQTRAIMADLGVEYVERRQTGADVHFNYRVKAGAELINVSDFDYALRIAALTTGKPPAGYWARFTGEARTIDILDGESLLIAFPLPALVDSGPRLTDDGNAVERQALTVEAGNERVDGLLVADWISGIANEDSVTVQGLQATIYLRYKEER